MNIVIKRMAHLSFLTKAVLMAFGLYKVVVVFYNGGYGSYNWLIISVLFLNFVFLCVEGVAMYHSERVAGWAMLLLIIGIITIASFSILNLIIGLVYILYSIYSMRD